MTVLPLLRLANLSLLILYPVAWFAPLLRAGLLPIFGLSEISVLTGLQSLWDSDIVLALVVTAFALFAPYLKTIGLALEDRRLPRQRRRRGGRFRRRQSQGRQGRQ